MRWLSRWGYAAAHLLYPRRCAGCGELNGELEYEMPLCPICYADWQAAKRQLCERCGKPQIFCRCGPASFSSVDRFVHVVSYEPGIAMQLLWKMKRERRPDLIRFAAEELSGVLLEELRRYQDYRGKCLLTYAPRRSKNVREFGLDQSKLLACEMAERLYLPFYKLICRKPRTAEQKQLTKQERMENAENAYQLVSGAEKEAAGRIVIIVDDVITTGATVSACAELLRHADAECVVAASLAKTRSLKKRAF